MKKPGVFDRVKIEYDRHADHIFNAGDIVVDIVRGTGEYRDTGSGGERRTYNILREMFSNHLIFRNVYLTKADGKLTEIDLMAIGKQGLFVIESKNYSGWIFGDSSQRYWTATLPNGQKNRFYSPIFQNASHIKALAEKFGERYPQMEYYSLVVFSERCELKKIVNTEPDTFVFQRPELRFYIKQIIKDHSTGVLSESDVEEIAAWLRVHERPDETVKEQHLTELEKAKHICPWCGKELVERRNNKTGDTFIGCSGFPKCRYTAKGDQ